MGTFAGQQSSATTSPTALAPEQHISSSRPNLRTSRVTSLAVPRNVREVLAAPGQPLDQATREFMEPRFRQDFTKVRVHSDPVAQRSARELRAHAYTVGNDIVFASGRFASGTPDGQRLIAHELAHVVQQGRAGSAEAGAPAMEQAAEQAAEGVALGSSGPVAGAAKLGIARQDDGSGNQPRLDGEELRRRTELLASPQLLSAISAITTPQREPGEGTAPQSRPLITAEDFANALRNGPTGDPNRDPNKVVWLGNPSNRPSWTQGAEFSKDARGNMTVGSPEMGRTTFTPSGKRLTPVPNGDAEKIQRALRAANYLQQTGGKRVVEGKGALDEAGWKQHIEERKRVLSVDVEDKFAYLSNGVRLFHETQTGIALPAAVPAHVLGGRRLGDSQRIVSSARQDIEIAKHQMDAAQTPEELAEAEHHLQFVVGYAEAQFTRYKDDVYAGGENTITGIKVTAAVAVSGAALATPALVAAGGAVTAKTVGVGALAGGGFSAARQVAEIHDGTRQDFSLGEVGTGMVGGAALGVVPGAAPLLMGPAVASSADEFAQGHPATGAIDAVGALAPIGAARAAQPGTGRSVGNYFRPRAAGLMMRAGQGIENVPGLGGSSPTGSIPYEGPLITQAAVSKPVATPQPPVSEPVITAKPEASTAVSTADAPTVDPTIPTVGEGPVAKAANFDVAPAKVGDKAFQARRALTILNAMRASPRNTIGTAGEASHLTSGASTGIDLNEVSPNHPQIDLSSRDTFTSVKNFGVNKPLDQSTMKRYDKELRTLRTPEEAGIPTKLGEAAKRLADNRQAIQGAGAWPKGLARDATPEQIAKFINRQGAVGIPSDHVQATRAYIAERARADPEAYGLKEGAGLEKGIDRLVERIQPNGLSSKELLEISKKAIGP